MFQELEFGCEAAFVRARGREAGVRTVDGKTARIYALQAGDQRLEVLLTDRGVPAEVAYYQGARTVLSTPPRVSGSTGEGRRDGSLRNKETAALVASRGGPLAGLETKRSLPVIQDSDLDFERHLREF